MSSDDEDPRFRIPRGSSDEEIDSDLASVSSTEAAAVAPPRRREAINHAASVLRAGFPAPSSSDESEPDDGAADAESPDRAALSAVTLAATGRRDLSEAERRAARDVLPAGEETMLPVSHRDGKGQGDMMARMLHVLTGADGGGEAGEDGGKIAGLADLKKKVARLSAGGKKALAVPLPEPVQGRLERGEAYKLAKEEVSAKWAGIVAKNRKKDVLDFTKGGVGETVGRNTGVVAEGFKPSMDYEKEIQKMLKEAGVASDVQVVKNEEKDFQDQLGVAGVSKEELLERRRELAKVRSLMFHYEHKMKRIKKIKSRKYRRILKKEKERLTEGRMGDDDDEGVEEQQMKKERKRAEERMTLRHKNTSKWVRRQLRRGETKRNPETRAAVEEQLQLHEDLKRRQEGMMNYSDDSDSDGSGYGEDATEEQLDAEMEEIRKSLNEEKDELSAPKKRKGLMGMKFMKVADERQRIQAQALLDQMKKDDSDASEAEDDSVAPKVGRQSFSGGAVKERETREKRIKSDEGNVTTDVHVLSEDEDDAEALKQRVVKEYEESAKSATPGMGGASLGASEKLSLALKDASKTEVGFTTTLDGKLKATTAALNPWLRARVAPEENANSKEIHVSENGQDQSDREKLKMKVASGREASKDGPSTVGEHSKKNRKRMRSTQGEPKITVVDSGKDLIGRKTTAGEASGKKGKSGTMQSGTGEQEPGADSVSGKVDDSESHVRGKEGRKRKKRAMEDSEDENEAGSDWDDDDVARMKLVAKAFSGAGGADEADFAAMKEAEIGRSLPTASDIGAEVLPGWGSWDGAGMKKRRKGERRESAFARAARERLEAARAQAISKRADRELAHVILDERRIKQATELTLSSVPFPFTNVQQWQRELATPVCRELVTTRTFDEQVKGHVKKKSGVAIQPMQLSEGREGMIAARKRKVRERSAKRKGLLL